MSDGLLDIQKVEAAIVALIDALGDDRRAAFLKRIAFPLPRGSKIMRAVYAFAVREGEFTTADVLTFLTENYAEKFNTKQVNNALAYLVRCKHLSKGGYGHYCLNGVRP